MRSSEPRRAALAVLAACVLGLGAGCGDNDSRTDPTPTTASTSAPTTGETSPDTGVADDVCHRISDADLSDWAGTEVTVRDQDDDDGATVCETIFSDTFAPVRISWTLEESEGSLQADADRQHAAGLRQERATLPSGADAIAVKGTIAGARQLFLVAGGGDGTAVTVHVNGVEGLDPVPFSRLFTIASSIADTYAS